MTYKIALVIAFHFFIQVADHAKKVVDMALDMADAVTYIEDPRPDAEDHVKLRVGCHTGMVVAGIVEDRQPRYCAYGKL